MGKPQRWKKTYSQLAAEHGVKESSFKFWAKEGHDLNSDEVVQSLISKARNRPVTGQGEVSPRSLSLDKSLGLAGSLQRLREAELELSKAYASALADGSPTATTLRKEWLSVCESLRKAENDSPDVSQANKKTITVDTLNVIWDEVFFKLRTSLDGLAAKVSQEIPQQFAVVIYNNVRDEVNRYIKELSRCQFLEDKSID